MSYKFEADDTMIEIIDEIPFYTDKNNKEDVYVEYTKPDGSYSFCRPDSKTFQAYLGYEYRKRENVIANPDFQALIDIKCQDAIAAQAAPVAIHHRLTGSLSKEIIYFLGDKEGRCVVIRPGEWEIRLSSSLKKNKFLQTTVDLPQSKPVKGGNYLDLLRPYVNLPMDDFKLLAICLVQFFSRRRSHFALIFSSGKGTGKSTLTKVIQALIDPSRIEATVMTYNEQDLKVLLGGSFLVCFDNTDHKLKTGVSNLLCSAITGGTAAKRRLYTNTDIVVLNLHNAIILNGIDIIPPKSDLVDRSLLFELQPFDKNNNRQTERVFWENYERDRPKILGAIFDTLSRAMTILPTIQPETPHRMADAHEEMLAIAQALDISEEEFTRIFQANLDRLQETYAQSNGFIEHVLDYMSKKPSGIKLPARKLFYELKDAFAGPDFPKSSSAFSRRLNEEKDAFLNAGYEITTEKRSDANYIHIAPVPQNRQTKAQKEAIAARDKAQATTSTTT